MPAISSRLVIDSGLTNIAVEASATDWPSFIGSRSN